MSGTVETCSVDPDAIAAHFEANVAWQAVPILGSFLAQVASPKLPDGDQKDLDKANGDLQFEIDQWRNDITALAVQNTENFYTLTDILPDYVKAIATMAVLPTSIKTNILYVQVITLSIIMAIVIFLGI